MIDDRNEHDPFIERIARPLRAQERPDATFEARAMSAVHAAARADAAAEQRRSWWLRPRSVRLSPLASLALAAGFAGLVLTGSQAVSSIARRAGSEPPQAGHTDTVHIVRFVLVDPSARSVALVGAFNQWQKDATPLVASATSGVWLVDVTLRPGHHEYAFIVVDDHGERWVADPLRPAVRDEFGTESSVISVGTASS